MSSETGPRPRRGDPFQSAAKPRRNPKPDLGPRLPVHLPKPESFPQQLRREDIPLAGGRLGSFCAEAATAGPGSALPEPRGRAGGNRGPEAGHPTAGPASRPAGGCGRRLAGSLGHGDTHRGGRAPAALGPNVPWDVDPRGPEGRVSAELGPCVTSNDSLWKKGLFQGKT